MDLLIDSNAFNTASAELKKQRDDVDQLITSLSNSVVQLRQDWNSEAGRKFFERFDGKDGMIKHLKEHATVFEHMSTVLIDAADRYDAVAQAAKRVSEAAID